MIFYYAFNLALWCDIDRDRLMKVIFHGALIAIYKAIALSTVKQMLSLLYT